MKNYDLVIVQMHTLHVYDFVDDSETKEEAEARGQKYYQEELALVSSHLKNYGGDYWTNQVATCEKIVAAGCKVMKYGEFAELEKQRLLSGELKEIDADTFEEMLNILPPLYWTTHNGVEMFCMREMYAGTYTNQYAHDKRTGKYYTKMVDCADYSTWICNLLTA